MAKKQAAASNPPTSQKGKSRHRSPNYPMFDLGKAVERAKQLYDADKTHKVPIDVVHDRWGYKKHSSAGNQAVAAVKSYGLVAVEGAGKQRLVAVTDIGRRIVLNAPERAELLKKAALGPALFNNLWERYRESGVPSNEVLSHHLMFDRNFNEDVVANAIERFRATVTYANLAAGDRIEGGGEGDDEEEEAENNGSGSGTPPATIRQRKRTMQAGVKEDVFSLDNGQAVVVQWPGSMDPALEEDVEDWLKIIGRKIKRAFATAASDESDEDE